MPQTLDALLTGLEAAKGRFGPDAAEKTKALLDQLARCSFRDPKPLIRFHEALLFLRAFPQSASLVPGIEKLLNSFHERVDFVREAGADMSEFDDFDTSGIAGTVMQDSLNFEAARWLARRIPRNVEIAWDDYAEDYPAERAMGSTWPRFIQLLVRDREGAELYDSLHLPLRWHLENLKFSRTRNWTRPRQFYYHTEPLIVRSQVSLATELARPAPQLVKLSRPEGESILHTVREVMAVRYRELYGTTLSDPDSVVRATLGRGVGMYFWSLPPARRLPLRAYVAGFTLKNGVPINYIEAIGLCEWIEVG